MQGPRTRISSCVTAESGWPLSICTTVAGNSTHIAFVFFRTPRSAPHFTTQPRAQPFTGRVQWGRRGDQAAENVRHKTPRHRWKSAPGCRGATMVQVWGSPWHVERAPRKLGWWGAKRVEEVKRRHSRCRLSVFHSLHRYSQESSSLSR